MPVDFQLPQDETARTPGWSSAFVRWVVGSVAFYPVYLGVSLLVDFIIGDQAFVEEWTEGSRRELLRTLTSDWGHTLLFSLPVTGIFIALASLLRRRWSSRALAGAALAVLAGIIVAIATELWAGVGIAAALFVLTPLLLPRGGA